MSREVRRVPLDFDWPLSKVWEGYLSPDRFGEKPCPDCKNGYSPITADDLLLDDLGSATPNLPAQATNDPLSDLFLGWRNEVESLDPSDLVDLDTAVDTIAVANQPAWNLKALIRTAVLGLLVLAALLAVFAAMKAGAA